MGIKSWDFIVVNFAELLKRKSRASTILTMSWSVKFQVLCCAFEIDTRKNDYRVNAIVRDGKRKSTDTY